MTRGSNTGISTLNWENKRLFVDSDNIWRRNDLGNYNIALDVHWTMEKIYDWVKYYFDYNSYDGNNCSTNAYICDSLADTGYSASSNMFIFCTNKNGNVLGPAASVDVVGHEYGHAILYNSAGLSPYVNTSNLNDRRDAIHEGLADIWGIIFETHITPSADIWKTGEQIMINNTSCMRNFKNPGDLTAETQISRTYGHGQFYSDDPHEVGGLLPHWFYLLSQGKSGTNENLDNYTVFPVGVDLAEQLIAYATLTSAYLEDCTTFQDVRAAIYDASLDMEDNPFLSEQVQNAFYAVGLDIEPSHIYGPSVVNGSGVYTVHTDTGFNLSWNYTNISGTSPTLVVNNTNHTCTVNATSPFSGKINATLSYGSLSATYSMNISGTGNTNSALGGDVLQISAQNNSCYLISLAAIDKGLNANHEIKVFNAANFKQKSHVMTRDSEYVLNTSSWKPGVYIIRAYIDGKPYTAKISIK